MGKNKTKQECDRCGTCCTNGGPALHNGDMVLLQDNWLNPEHLITIRKGEPVFSPTADKPEPAVSEIIKIKGQGVEWTCLFFHENDATCEIYEHRPLECSLLKCWDTDELEKIAGKNLLNRRDIIAPHDPVLAFVEIHDEKCGLEKLAHLLAALNKKDSQQQVLTDLTSLVNTDLTIRSQACARFGLSLDLELFFFGRPLFKILNQFDLVMHEHNGVFRMSLTSSRNSATLVNT